MASDKWKNLGKVVRKKVSSTNKGGAAAAKKIRGY